MMKNTLYSCLAPLALVAISFGQGNIDQANSPLGDRLEHPWIGLDAGMGINGQTLQVDLVQIGQPFRATLNIQNYNVGHAGLLIGTATAPPNTVIMINGQASQLFLDLSSVQLVLFQDFDFGPAWWGTVTFQTPPVPPAFLGFEWYAQAYVSDKDLDGDGLADVELSTMAMGNVGHEGSCAF